MASQIFLHSAADDDDLQALRGGAQPEAGGGGGRVDLAGMMDKMELIAPADIQLQRFLGSGG